MSFQEAQLQNFALAGGGAVSGATSVVLKSFQTIDGVDLAMTDFGSIGYGTLEPGNGNQEEQISFTGVVQNSNGTATLSGIKHVLFTTPYTETSGLTKTHSGSSIFVISNTSGFYEKFPKKENDETITGQWTFTTFPITPANSDASTTVKGVTKLSVAPVSATNPIAVGNNDQRLVYYAVSATGTDAYAITAGTATAYVTGQWYGFKADVANAGAATLNVNALGAIGILRDEGSALVDNDITAGAVVLVVYNGTNFIMVNDVKSTDYQAFTASGSWTKPSGLSGNELVLIQAWGAGGSGGGITGSFSGNGWPAGGGGGAFAQQTFKASQLGSSETVTVGAGGTAGVAGGNTTFGSLLTAYGGGSAQNVATTNQGSSAGGGGGLKTAGGNGNAPSANSDEAGGAGGTPIAGSGAIGTTVAGTSTFGGAGGGGHNGATNASCAGGESIYGGAGGGGVNTNASTGGTNVGGNSYYGGAGGGGSNKTASAIAAGGTSTFGGAGGTGVLDGNGTAGTAPGGGGGAAAKTTSSNNYTGGAGARGEVRVWVIRS